MKTGRLGKFLHRSALLLFTSLLKFYPSIFRSEYADEIEEVFARRLEEAGEGGSYAWLGTVFREFTALVISILRESWHEFRTCKGDDMDPESPIKNHTGILNQSGQAFQPMGAPGLSWVATWTLLVTATILLTAVTHTSLTVTLTWVLNLGAAAGLWPLVQASALAPLGTLTSFALIFALIEWSLLRRYLPGARLWFFVTVLSLLVFGLAIWIAAAENIIGNMDPFRFYSAVILLAGAFLGLAQWLYLRRFLSNAAWMVVINLLAAGSILLAGQTFNSPTELTILVLPAIITGVGLLFLLRQVASDKPSRVQAKTQRGRQPWVSRLARIGLLLAALVPLFFIGIWVYSASQLAVAKSEGIYPTVEKAIIERYSQDFGGAKVISIEIHASQNSSVQPHVWYGGATITLDRVPQGYSQKQLSGGSFYLRVRDGWVLMSEAAFPEFIGWVMELYNMEGVREWAANQ